jgi:MFS family permease
MNRNFFLLWQGQMISQIGSQISTIAVLFWLKHATESPILIGALAMLSGLVSVLLGPIGGAFADRHSRRSIIVMTDLIGGLAVTSLSILMLCAPAMTGLTMVWIFVVSIAISALTTFSMPAISAATADLAPPAKVAAANSMLQASTEISTLLGQGIGGLLFRMLGAPVALLIDGLTYFFSALIESFMTIPQTLPERDDHRGAQIRGFKREIREGFTYVRANTGLTQLMLIATFLNFFMAPVLGLLPFYIEDYLKLHPDWFGYFLTSYGIGSLIGYVLAGTVPTPGSLRAGLIFVFMLMMSILCGLLGVVKTPAAVIAIAIGCGAASGFLNINVSTILQLTTPSEIRGRVFGLLSTISACLLPIGMGLAGVAASLVGKNIPLIYLFCGACMLLVTLSASVLGEVRGYLAFDSTGVREASSLTSAVEEAAGTD